MFRLRFLLMMGLGLGLLVACGDDGGGDDDDAGVTAQPDTGPPRPECGPLSQECDVRDPASCGSPDLMGCYLFNVEGAATPQCGAPGVLGEGMPCETPTQCAPGFYCHSELDTCQEFCCGNSDCPDGQTCGFFADTALRGLGQCTPSCDFQTQTGCAEGQGCYLQGQTGVPAACLLAGDAATGEACERENDCAPGHRCLGIQGTIGNTCILVCDLNDVTGEACAEGETCQPQTVVPSPLGLCLTST
jgi:hypothetical protein